LGVGTRSRGFGARASHRAPFRRVVFVGPLLSRVALLAVVVPSLLAYAFLGERLSGSQAIAAGAVMSFHL
jgi:hypothetical protein